MTQFEHINQHESVFHIASSTNRDEDCQLNQNLSIIIIFHTKIILIKYFFHSEKKKNQSQNALENF